MDLPSSFRVTLPQLLRDANSPSYTPRSRQKHRKSKQRFRPKRLGGKRMVLPSGPGSTSRVMTQVKDGGDSAAASSAAATDSLETSSPLNMDSAAGGSSGQNDLSLEEETADMICIKVKDLLGITPACGVNANQTLLYPPTATFGQLVKDVSEKFSMPLGDFELVYQARMDLYEFTSMPPDQPLTVANLVPSRDKAYCVTINGASKRKGKGRASFSKGEAEDLAAYLAPLKDRSENADGSMEPNDSN